MARIEDHLLDCAFYLYPSLGDAKSGAARGATGFFLSVESAVAGYKHVYAVTNKHCIQACQESACIRAKGIRTDPLFIDSEPDQWEIWPRHDVAMLPLSDEHASEVISLTAADVLISKDDVEAYGIGPGDRVFMVGRFVNHDGGPKNIPSVRFGNVSTMPGAFKHPQGLQDVSWGVEMRSISGYSGSPVFLYWGHFDMDRGGKRRDNTEAFFGCLGVDWGHLPYNAPLRNSNGIPAKDGSFVRMENAMCGVVPSWDLQWCIDQLKDQRAMAEKKQAESPAKAVLDFSEGKDVPPANDANPNHREDFTRLLGAAARKPPQED